MKLVRVLLVAFVLSLAVLSVPACETREATADLRDAAIAERDKIDKSKTDLEAKTGEIDKSAATLREKIAELESERDALAENLDDAKADAATSAAIAASREDVLRRLAESRTSLAATDKFLSDARSSIAAANAKSAELASEIAAADKALAETEDGKTNPGTTIGTILATFWPGFASAAPLVLGAGWRSLRLSGVNKKLRTSLDVKTSAQDRIVASIEVLAKIAPEVAAAIDKHARVIDEIQGPAGKTAVDESQSRNSAKLNVAA